MRGGLAVLLGRVEAVGAVVVVVEVEVVRVKERERMERVVRCCIFDGWGGFFWSSIFFYGKYVSMVLGFGGG